MGMARMSNIERVLRECPALITEGIWNSHVRLAAFSNTPAWPEPIAEFRDQNKEGAGNNQSVTRGISIKYP